MSHRKTGVLLSALMALTLLVPSAVWGQLGGRYRLKYARSVFHALDQSGGKPATKASSAPVGAIFEIVKPDAGDGKKWISFTEVPPTTGPALEIQLIRSAEMIGAAVPAAGDNPNPPAVVTDVVYQVSLVDLPSEFYELVKGGDVGVLAVPFKIQLGDGKITAGATLGPYIGYHQRWLLGLPSTVLLTAGLAAVPTAAPTSTPSTTPTVDTKIGFTGAIGVVAEPWSQFEIGVIAGWDHVGEHRNVYPYEDKWWLSLSIGTTVLKRQ